LELNDEEMKEKDCKPSEVSERCVKGILLNTAFLTTNGYKLIKIW